MLTGLPGADVKVTSPALRQARWDPLRRENAQRLRRKLDDIDYLKLRTAPGRMGQIRKMI